MWLLWKIILKFSLHILFLAFQKAFISRESDVHCFLCPIINFFIINVEKINYHSHHLKVHIKTIHKCQKDFKCDSCGKSFSHSHHLRIHIKTIHKGHKDFKCDACGNFHWDIQILIAILGACPNKYWVKFNFMYSITWLRNHFK